jgi:hypothetical protein
MISEQGFEKTSSFKQPLPFPPKPQRTLVASFSIDRSKKVEAPKILGVFSK